MVDGHGDAVDDPALADPALPWNRERGDVGGDREQQEEHERGHPLHSYGVLGRGHHPFRDFLLKAYETNFVMFLERVIVSSVSD